MSVLHQLTGQYLQLWNEVDNDEFDLDSLGQAFDSLEGEIKIKSENVAKYIQNIDATADAIDSAIKQMQHRKKVMQNKSESMKAYLFLNMKNSGITKIDCPHFSLSIKKNPASVRIVDAELIHKNFIKTKTVESIDKVAIKAALKDGHIVEGAELAQSDRLEIK